MLTLWVHPCQLSVVDIGQRIYIQSEDVQVLHFAILHQEYQGNNRDPPVRKSNLNRLI